MQGVLLPRDMSLRQLFEKLQETETITGLDRWIQDYDVALGKFFLIPL